MPARTRSRWNRVSYCQYRNIACEHPTCTIREYAERMVRTVSGEWFCPAHGLLVAAKELVSLYRVKGEADWTAISEIIGETLPKRIAKLNRMVLWGTGWVLTHDMVRRVCQGSSKKGGRTPKAG